MSTIQKCLEISTITLHYPFSFKKKFHLTIKLNGLGLCDSSLYSFYSPYTRPFNSIKLSSCFVCKAREAFDAVQLVTDCNWNDLVIASDNLVIVEFWAPPCSTIELMVDELLREYDGHIECYKMNIDDYPNIPKQLGIKSIPAVLFFKDGERKESIVGDVSKSAVQATIDKYLDG